MSEVGRGAWRHTKRWGLNRGDGNRCYAPRGVMHFTDAYQAMPREGYAAENANINN
ncbi:MAG: hypothetical protein WKF84_21955 [Pyrinomonadaceae bacterium]